MYIYIYIYIYIHAQKHSYTHTHTHTLAGRVKCSPLTCVAGVQSQVESYQRFKNDTWFLLA